MTAAASFPSMYVPCQPYVALTLLYLLLQSDDVIYIQGMYLSEDAGGQVPGSRHCHHTVFMIHYYRLLSSSSE